MYYCVPYSTIYTGLKISYLAACIPHLHLENGKKDRNQFPIR